jgi:hypothetical protein
MNTEPDSNTNQHIANSPVLKNIQQNIATKFDFIQLLPNSAIEVIYL